jgi:hypothetical protein
MNLSQFQRFMHKADATLGALFPATVRIGGVSYAASAVGGSAFDDYVDGGKALRGERHFRIPKSALPDPPAIGSPLSWVSGERDVALEVMECPDRPHETSWALRCEPRNR